MIRELIEKLHGGRVLSLVFHPNKLTLPEEKTAAEMRLIDLERRLRYLEAQSEVARRVLNTHKPDKP